MDLEAGVVVAERFRLVRPLGQGGMGAVWLAHHTGLDTPCAVKFIHEEAARSPELRARFEREAKAAASLRSPHVVQILDHGVWQQVPYIAMELLEGEDLAKRLRRRRPLEPREVLAIAAQVGRALTKAHAAGLVHRDLKPANIFLVQDDDREIAKVLDFGVAKSTAVGTPMTTEGDTKTGAVLGTPFYMSPEQARGNKDVDHRADLWALSVVVYQCLTGKLPFRSEALGDLLVKIIVEPLPVPSAVASVPPGFDAWWRRAAERDITQRFQTAKELTEALGLALDCTVPGSSEVGSAINGLSGDSQPSLRGARAPSGSFAPRDEAASSDGSKSPIKDSAMHSTAAPQTLAATGPSDTSPAPLPLASRVPMLAAAAAGVLLLAGVGALVALRGGPSAEADRASSGAHGSVASSAPPPPITAIAPSATATAAAEVAPVVAESASARAPASAAPAVTPAPTTRPRVAVPPATKPPAGPKPKTDFGI